MKTSSSKADLLSELRDKYISKYGTEPEIQNTINEQLETLKAKSKLTIKDLTDIETTISNTSKVVLSKSSSASNLQPLQSLKGGVEPNLNSIRLPTLDIRSPNQRKIVSNRYNTDRGYDNSILELSDVNGLSPSIKYTSSPFALNKLRSSKSPLAFSTPTANMLTDLSGFGVNFEKTEQYNLARKEEIWGKIVEYQLQQEQKKEQQKREEKTKQKNDWVNDLQIQIAASKTKEKDEKEVKKTTEIAQIEDDLKLSQELQDKRREQLLQKLRKNKEALNLALEEKKKVQELKRARRKKDAEEMDEFIQKTRIEVQEEKERRRKQQEHVYLTNLKLQNMKTQEMLEERKKVSEMNRKMIDYQMENRDKLDDEVNKFYDNIRLRVLKQPNPSFRKDGFDNLRRYGSIEKETSNESGILMNLSPKTDRLNEKQQKQVLLSKVYTMQMKEKAEREKEYENMQKEQAELWKKEREKYEEEQAMKKNKQKDDKEMLRVELEQQIAEKEHQKRIFVDPKELWVNRRLLRQMRYQSANDGSLGIQYKKLP